MEENINEVDTLEKGDLLVEHGEIYQVVSVKDQKNFKGETEAFIMYKPYFETYRNKSLLRSTPLSSLGLTSLRKPIAQEEVDDIFKMITTHPGPGSQFNQKSARDVLNSNAISKIAEIIQLIWAEQLGDDKDLSLTKKDLLSDAIQRVGQEISVVLEIDQEEAENMINKKLMKMPPKN